MAYTFSRRDFMKYTALAAAAVAVSGSLTGCSNPNQPTGKPGDTLSFGASSGIFGIGGSSDKHTLSVQNYDGAKLTCTIEHKPVGDSFSYGIKNYQVIVKDTDGITTPYNYMENDVKIIDGPMGGKMDPDNTYKADVTVSNIDFSKAEKVYFRYYPRITAIDNETDYMKDVHATWDITDVIKSV